MLNFGYFGILLPLTFETYVRELLFQVWYAEFNQKQFTVLHDKILWLIVFDFATKFVKVPLFDYFWTFGTLWPLTFEPYFKDIAFQV